jgi:hypothetical protein
MINRFNKIQNNLDQKLRKKIAREIVTIMLKNRQKTTLES